jgi:putative sigma-54 modulation protein
MEPIESLRTYAEEKISKIDKYIDSPIEAHIVLSVEKFRHLADVTVSINGTVVKGVEETEDMYSAIDQVLDKIEKQVKKQISKIRGRRPGRNKGESDLVPEEAESGKLLHTDEPTIQVEKMDAKPMDPEEAAMQLVMSPRDFTVFRNPRTGQINVIYKKRDGNLGLIEPSN